MKTSPKVYVEMGSNVMNFGYFMSGRHLSQNFRIVNESKNDQIITIKFAQHSEFSSYQMYECEELPFEY